MEADRKSLIGLTEKEAQTLLEQYGANELEPGKTQSFFKKALEIICEPMFLLLIAASVIYFLLGQARDGAVMLVFVAGIISIDIIQEWKTDKTLRALKNLSTPRVTVIRDGKQRELDSKELVPGDIMLIQEGVKIPADGVILRQSDLRTDESTLTGEAEGVWKVPYTGEEQADDYWHRDTCYAGTLVTQGSATVRVTKTGALTEYGKIGTAVSGTEDKKTPLQKQTAGIVKTSAGIAAFLFALVGAVTYLNLPEYALGNRLVESVLAGITLTMAMIPEEFPVILTVFLSMGAWRLARKNALVKHLPSVETLGAVTVLCVDKTGTITQNRMTVSETWASDGDEKQLCEIMGLACETQTYDPMEKAMLSYCETLGITKEHLFGDDLITEYAFTDELKMMGHVWHHESEIILAAKGSPEHLLSLCAMKDAEKQAAEEKVKALSQKGLRVIAVGMLKPNKPEDIPSNLSDARLDFCGLVGLYDPPRVGVKDDIVVCTDAGIRVVMITGDNGITAASIARQVGITGDSGIITGDMLDAMDDEQLCEMVKSARIFSRVRPEHKMRIIKALKANGEIVAMTGDGVNDAPALKSADIGISMGQRGSEVSREAADLILMDDRFSTIVETVRDGRRIFDNIRKAVGYVFTIHIPIAFSALLAPMLGIVPENVFLLPLHVVLLELVIDPTCSIVLERIPAENTIMKRPPRHPGEKLLTRRILLKSIFQGLAILSASFGAYYWTLQSAPSEAVLARGMGLAVILISNLLLVFVNASDTESLLVSVRHTIREKTVWIAALGIILMLAIILYTPVNVFLKLGALSAPEFLTAIGLAAAAVLWYEPVKAVLRIKRKKGTPSNRDVV